MRVWRLILGFALCALLGCKTASTPDWVKPANWGFFGPTSTLKPPPMPEQYVLPPEADTRFSRAIEYPEGTLKRGNGALEARQITPPPAGIGANAMGAGGGAANPAMNGVGGYR